MHINAVDLGHRYPTQEYLFEGLSFEWQSGDLVSITGPSGAGKSTLLGLLAGWIDPVSGNILRQGIERKTWVFQNPHGVASRSALDHVALPLLTDGAKRADVEPVALQILSSFGLAGQSQQRYSELSGGEAHRLMLARAVASKPDLLLVDEPTAQLDWRSADTVIAVLQELAGVGRIVAIATHDTRVTEKCTKSLILGAL